MDDQQKIPRKRVANFTADEKALLAQLIKKYPLVETKLTDHKSVAKKKTAWEQITQQFNCNANVHKRDTITLKRAWDNMKAFTRKARATERGHYIRTGGSPSAPLPSTEQGAIMNMVEEDELQKIPRKRVANFTADEKALLAQLIKKYPLVETKLTDHKSVAKKKTAWEQITQQFNCNANVHKRDTITLKRAWDNMKAFSRKARATERGHYVRIGGGPSAPLPSTEQGAVMNMVKEDDQQKIPRKRVANFTADEKALLAQLIKKYPLVETKLTDHKSVAKKKTAWEQITQQFNCNANVHKRDTITLKRAWDNMKAFTRKARATERGHYIRTGGGPSAPLPSTEQGAIMNMVEDYISYLGILCTDVDKCEQRDSSGF